MGSTFRLPVASADSLATAPGGRSCRRPPSVRRGASRRALPLRRRQPARPAGILLGGEGAGLLAPSSIAGADEALTIAMRPPVESLNVAIAAALVLLRSVAGRGPMSLFDDPDERAAATERAQRRCGRAARRAHAPAHPGRVRRPGRADRPRPSAAPGDRAGPPAVDHPLGTAGHRQDHARPADRDRYQGALHRVQRGAVGDQGDPQR